MYGRVLYGANFMQLHWHNVSVRQYYADPSLNVAAADIQLLHQDSSITVVGVQRANC